MLGRQKTRSNYNFYDSRRKKNLNYATYHDRTNLILGDVLMAVFLPHRWLVSNLFLALHSVKRRTIRKYVKTYRERDDNNKSRVSR